MMDLDKYLGKQVLITTKCGSTLHGTLQINNTGNYSDNKYAIFTNTDYTYYLDSDAIEEIEEC